MSCIYAACLNGTGWVHKLSRCCAQSLVLASLFAWMEGLFTLGYRPKLQAELGRRIAEKDRQCSADTNQPLLTSPGPVPNTNAQ